MQAAERAEGEAMDALAEMGKEEKKARRIPHNDSRTLLQKWPHLPFTQVRKGMEKLGMVPLDGLQQVANCSQHTPNVTQVDPRPESRSQMGLS